MQPKPGYGSELFLNAGSDQKTRIRNPEYDTPLCPSYPAINPLVQINHSSGAPLFLSFTLSRLRHNVFFCVPYIIHNNGFLPPSKYIIIVSHPLFLHIYAKFSFRFVLSTDPFFSLGSNPDKVGSVFFSRFGSGCVQYQRGSIIPCLQE